MTLYLNNKSTGLANDGGLYLTLGWLSFNNCGFHLTDDDQQRKGVGDVVNQTN